MRKLILSLCVLAVLLVVGCGPALSLHPLCTREESVFEPALVGRWGDRSSGQDENEEAWIFRKLEDNLYSVSLKWSSTDSLLPLEGRMVRVGDYTFMDVTAQENDIEDFLALPAHAFLRLDLRGDSLAVGFLYDSYVEDHCNLLKHEVVDGSTIITASPAELQAFVRQCAEDPEAFEMEWCYRK